MSNTEASPDQLEREITHTRAEIDHKLNLLQERLSPRYVASSMGEQGGAFVRNLGAALRDNPIPALLVCVGLCWLMFASRRNGRAEMFEDDFFEDDFEDFEDEFAAMPPGEPASLAPRTAAAMAAADSSLGREAQTESMRAEGDAAALGLTAGRR